MRDVMMCCHACANVLCGDWRRVTACTARRFSRSYGTTVPQHLPLMSITRSRHNGHATVLPRRGTPVSCVLVGLATCIWTELRCKLVIRRHFSASALSLTRLWPHHIAPRASPQPELFELIVSCERRDSCTCAALTVHPHARSMFPSQLTRTSHPHCSWPTSSSAASA